MEARLSSIGWLLIVIGLAGAGLAFLWMHREASPTMAARGLEGQSHAPALAPAASRAAQTWTVLFDFDRAELRPSSTALLDRVAGEMHEKRIRRLQAVGHADRIGSDAYNLALSLRRVETVTAYLASKGVSRDALHATAAGEHSPVTGELCAHGAPQTERLIGCLQPDRRVVLSAVLEAP